MSNDPKISPKVMKAAEDDGPSTIAMQTMLEIGHAMPCSMTAESTTEEMRKFFVDGVTIIDKCTNLSRIEAALKELVAAEENVIANLLTKETLMSKEALQRWTDANDRKTAALANAKALEVK